MNENVNETEEVEEEFSPITLRIYPDDFFTFKFIIQNLEDAQNPDWKPYTASMKSDSFEIKDVKLSSDNILEYIDVYVKEPATDIIEFKHKKSESYILMNDIARGTFDFNVKVDSIRKIKVTLNVYSNLSNFRNWETSFIFLK